MISDSNISDFALCEKIVNEFQNYELKSFPYSTFIRVLYFEGNGYYPHMIFGNHEFDDEKKIKESLQKDFECLDFNAKYDANKLVIIVNEPVDAERCAWDYEDDCYEDVESLFKEIYEQYYSVAMAVTTKTHEEKIEELKDELIVMKKIITERIFGEEDLGI